jgi:hypothetical protein
MGSSVGSAISLGLNGRVFQFSFCIGRIHFLNWPGLAAAGNSRMTGRSGPKHLIPSRQLPLPNLDFEPVRIER